MKTLLASLAFLAALSWAPPADCQYCYVNKCFTDFECGECSCMQPNGSGSEGFCG